MKPKVSIIVPVYNVETYLPKCLQSLKEQSYSNYEVILVDDGSTDNSADIIKDFCKDKENFFYICKENGGVSSARNTAIEAATGEWIVFIDGDDYIEKQYISSMVSAVLEHPADYCQTSNKKYYDADEYIRNSARKNAAYGTRTDTFEIVNYRYCWGGMYSARIIRDNGIRFDERLACGEDVSFNCDYMCHVKSCLIIPDAFYVYRIRKGSITSQSVRPEKKKHVYDHVISFWNSFENKEVVEARYKENHEFAEIILDHFLARIICAVLEKDNTKFNELVSDSVVRFALENYKFNSAPQKQKLLVALLKGRYFLSTKILIRIYYSKRIFAYTRFLLSQ